MYYQGCIKIGLCIYTDRLLCGAFLLYTKCVSASSHTYDCVHTETRKFVFCVFTAHRREGTQTGGLLGVSVYTQKLRYSTQALCRSVNSIFLLLIDKLPVNSTQSRSGVNRAAVAYTEKSDHTHKCSRLTNVADFVSVYYH